MKLFLLPILLCWSLPCLSSFEPEMKAYLNVPGPLVFNRTTFELAWSSHPNAIYYKQEYMPAGQTLERNQLMLVVEAVFTDLTVAQVVKGQTDVIDKQKKTDPVARYEVRQHPATGEVIVDFMLSSGTKIALDILEWNGYRFKVFEDAAGRRGIMLFAISKRSYGDNINTFMNSLKGSRKAMLAVLREYDLPEVTVKGE